MCKIFKVDKSSYYHWIKNGCKLRQIYEKLNELIEIIFVQDGLKINRYKDMALISRNPQKV